MLGDRDAGQYDHGCPPGSEDEEMSQTIETIKINGIDYVRADQVVAAQPNDKRAVVVVDRGWIFAGDVTEEDGRIRLSRAVWVFRWEGCGLDGVLRDPKSSKVQLRAVPDVDMPADAEIFRIPVSESWGL